jgi:uncharacterized repeat protein (TIGR03803 family)
LTLDSAGNLYGTTSGGGTGTACDGGCGTVFELKRTADGWKEEVLYNFLAGVDGAGPEAGVVFDNSGNLYGTTAGGGKGGTVFKLSPNSRGGWTERIIYSFDYYSDTGGNPTAKVTFDTQGNLFGTTLDGGTGGGCADDGCGAVFELKPQAENLSWTETTVHQFRGAPDGGQPSSGLALDSLGNLYGVTQFGGSTYCLPENTYGENEGCGTFYKLTPHPDGNWTEVIFSFPRGGGSGIYPAGGLLFDKAGHLLGTSQAGGDGRGVVFELHESQKNGWEENVMHILAGFPSDGSFWFPQLPSTPPDPSLVMDARGDLFGVTTAGGAHFDGIVFELRPVENGWTESILHNFAGGLDGSSPRAGLVRDDQGHLYGTTAQGGGGTRCHGGCGSVYEVAP